MKHFIMILFLWLLFIVISYSLRLISHNDEETIEIKNNKVLFSLETL